MSFSIQGHNNKKNRLTAADAMVTQPAGKYLQTIFFEKGGHRGRLAVWENRVEWEVFTDSQYQQHLDWNHPDCRCLDRLVSPLPILYVLSELVNYGWKYIKTYNDEDN